MVVGVKMLEQLPIYIQDFVLSMGALAPILACILIVMESILPVLPLFVFITINFLAFGHVLGFLISWLFTCLGCFLSYFLVRKGFSNWTMKKAKKYPTLNDVIKFINKVSPATLAGVIACPFMPAFAINIASGLVKMDFKKFAIAILIGKVCMVYFWGYLGTGLIDSMKDPTILLKILIMILAAYLATLLINKVIKD